MSRDHRVAVSSDGVVTVVGGKWTTYRRMAEDAIDAAVASASLNGGPSRTSDLRLYGTDADEDQSPCDLDPESTQPIHADLPYTFGDVVRAVRSEMARTVEDVLARRTRSLFLDAAAASDAAEGVAAVMAREMGRTVDWAQQQVAEFRELARRYLVT